MDDRPVDPRSATTRITLDLRDWVNEGLMTFFFLVVGLEAKRELDVGQLRERRRLAIPLVAALGGMALPVLIYLAFNAGGQGARLGRRDVDRHRVRARRAGAARAAAATRLRVRLLTLAVVDDLVALLVIATVYTEHVVTVALLVAVGLFAALFALRYRAVDVARGRSRCCSASASGSRCTSRASTR